MRKRNNKGCTGCLAAFLFLAVGGIVGVIGYNTWRGKWLLIGLVLVSVGIALTFNSLLSDEDDDGDDDTWWLE